jgi:hypothetical protein
MSDLSGIFSVIREDIHLFWLLLLLAVIGLGSLMDEHDSLSYTMPQYIQKPYIPYIGCVPVEEIYEQPRAGIGIGSVLSSHSGAIVPRQYTAQRNCLVGANI